MNSRAKGARLERAIANDLRRWLAVECPECLGGGVSIGLCPSCDGKGYTSDYEVTRNETSYQAGKDGRAGEFNITGPRPHPICWEVKSAGGFDERQLFRDPITGPLPAFWEQATTQAGSLAPERWVHPVLVCKRTRGVTLAFMRNATSMRIVGATMNGEQRPIMRVVVHGDTVD